MVSQWNRIAMGMKGAGPYFQGTIPNEVLNGLVYEICEIYIDDVLIHGKSDPEFLDNTRRVFDRLRDKNMAVNPRKTELGLSPKLNTLVTSSSQRLPHSQRVPRLHNGKRMKVLDFPQPTTQKKMIQFIGLANYFRDHVPNMTEMVKPLRDMITLSKSQRTGKLIWTTTKSFTDPPN